MELKFTKRRKSVRAGYNVLVETMVGDGDRYPKYTKFFKELSDEFKLLYVYIMDSSKLTEEEHDKASDLFIDVQNKISHKLHGLFFHWDANADEYEEIQYISIVYTDEDDIDYDVTIE